MVNIGHGFFVECPRTIDDLMKPHLLAHEREYRIVKTIELGKMNYENFITDMLVLQGGLIRLAPSRWRQFRSVH